MTTSFNAKSDGNGKPTLIALASDGSGAIVDLYASPTTHRLLVDLPGNASFFADTVSGSINGSNVTFTVSNTISTALVLFLNGIPYQPGVDFTVSGTTITMTTAPDVSLSGTPFWLLHT